MIIFIKLFIKILLFTYLTTVAIAYCMTLPISEDDIKEDYTDKNINYYGRGLEIRAFITSLFGPIIIFYIIVYRKKEKIHMGFRCWRKYVKYYKKEKRM